MKAPAGNRFADRSRKGGLGKLSSPVGSEGTGAPSVGRLAGSLALFASVVALSLGVFGGAASSAFAEACPNEALRAENNSLGLPDCRAYEQATPTFQNGFGSAGILALAPGAEELIATETPGFAGTESNFGGPVYKMIRTAGGWQTASVAPSAAKYPTNVFYSASQDLSKSLWALRTPTESILAQSLYLREPDGSFVKVGSMVPPSSEAGPRAGSVQYFLGSNFFAGASNDLSHVYFSIFNGGGGGTVWPGDTTVEFGKGHGSGSSLYEYTGVGNTRPALVGVNGEGRVISDCGTFLGSLEGHEVYNAVSADGRTAYFSAEGHNAGSCATTPDAPEVTEVYARLNGSETVPISEPSQLACAECLTSIRRPAQFQGASRDGSKAFFTTTQELLPGAETENLYEYDFNAGGGERVKRLSVGALAPEVLGVARVSEDGSRVYFVAAGRLTEVPRGGCIAEETPTEQTEEEETHEGRCRPKQNHPNLYVYQRETEHPAGRVAFVATLSEADEEDWRASDSRPVQATPTGTRLVFVSGAALTPGAPGGAPQVFEFDATTEELVRVSRGQNGFPQGTVNADNSFGSIGSQTYSEFMRPTSPNTFLSISNEGSEVMFYSRAALTPTAEGAAENHVTSIYEYRSGATLSDGDVFLLSGGQDVGSANVQGISPAGGDAYFSVTDSLASAPTAPQLNIFDARIDGGFALSPSLADCEGKEACLAAAPQPPPEPPPPGSLVATEGNGPESVSPRRSSKELQKALKKCRSKSNTAARRSCEKQAHKNSKRPSHSAQAKGR